jgi:O-antigen ligase
MAKNIILLFPLLLVIPFGVKISGVKVTFAEFIIIGLFLLTGISQILNYQQLKLGLHNSASLLVALFTLTLSVSFFLNPIISIGIQTFIRLIEGIIFFFFIRVLIAKYKINIDDINNSLIISGIFASLVIFYQILTGYGLENIEGKALHAGRVFHGGGFGIFPSLSFVLLAFKFSITKHQLIKLFYLCLAGICLLAIILSSTRTWLAASVIALIYVMGKNKFGYTALYTGLVLLLGPLIIILITSSGLLDGIGSGTNSLNTRLLQLTDILFFETEETTIASRSLKWTVGFSIFLQNIFLGSGLENFSLGLLWIEEAGNRRTDSQYLDLLVMTGIIGSFPIIGLFLIIIKNYLFKFDTYKGHSSSQAILAIWIVGGIFWSFLYSYLGMLFYYIIASHLGAFNNTQGVTLPNTKVDGHKMGSINPRPSKYK